MHIFITNDDGFEAPGIIALAKKVATLGRVTVLAPDQGRSSCSSALSLRTFLQLRQKESYGEDIEVLACSGTTADCCKLGLEYWLKNDPPDLILSGINHGYNIGSDCLYSGTVAGALEGVFYGIPSMAVSAETTMDPGFLEEAADFALQVVETYFVKQKYQGILNLNMPHGEAPLDWERLKIVKLGLQCYDNAIREMKDPAGQQGFWLSGKAMPNDDPATDVYWVHRGFPTLTPLTWNQTDKEGLASIAQTAKEKILERE